MSACAAFLALSYASVVRAQGMLVDVPADCGSRAAFLREVESLREAPLETEPAVDLRIVRTGSRFRMTLASEAGVRTLEDTRCPSLFEAAALMVGVDLERAATQEVSAAPSAAPAEIPVEAPKSSDVPPAVRAPEAPRRDAPSPTRSRSETVRGFVDLAGGLARGPTPALAARLELGGGMRFGRFGTRLGAHYGSPRRVEGVRVQDVGASLVASARAPAWLELGVGIAGHALPGRGGAGGRDVSLSLGPRAELWFLPVLRRAELAIGAAFTYLPRRPEFVSSDGTRLYRAPPVAIALAARGRLGFF